MTLLTCVTLFVTLVAPSSAHIGYASIYDRGVMGRVARNRDLPIVGCMIASPLVSKDTDIGRWVTVVSLVTSERVKCRVTDVVRQRDMVAHMVTRHYVEFDNPTGLRMCRQAYAGQKPRRACPVTIIL